MAKRSASAINRSFERTFNTGDHMIHPHTRFATSYERSLQPKHTSSRRLSGGYKRLGFWKRSIDDLLEIRIDEAGTFRLSGQELSKPIEGLYTQKIDTRAYVFPKNMNSYIGRFEFNSN